MVLVGLISDTHDNLEAIRRAVEIFNARKVELVLHAGDFNAPFTVKAFKPLKAKLIGVFGNVDGERLLLRKRYTEMINAEIPGEFAEVEVGGCKLALLHGTIQPVVEALALSGRYRVVVRGHTHQPEKTTLGQALIVNPGEACGYLTGRKTIALLDTERLEAEFVEI